MQTVELDMNELELDMNELLADIDMKQLKEVMKDVNIEDITNMLQNDAIQVNVLGDVSLKEALAELTAAAGKAARKKELEETEDEYEKATP